MKVIWNPASTLDGNIATADGNSDWPTEADGNLFDDQVRECGAVIVGRNTFEQYKGEVFPINGATTYVWTHSPEIGEKYEGVEYISGSPAEVVAKLEEKGFSSCVLAGGSITNDAFVAAGLVDEVIVTIYPLMFGAGMRLLSSKDTYIKLKLIETKEIGDDVIRNKYSIVK